MANSLALEEMLNEHWINAIGELVSSQPDAERFLGLKRDVATIPERKLTFTSLNQLPPKDINVVIFGQDPYPRAESAIGVAFNDGQIHNWSDKFSPSFANIIKNLLYGKGLVSVDQGVADVRKTLAREGIIAPPAWFEHTIKSGVCWLNTSLTFTSTDLPILAEHLKFWKPIVEGILSALMAAKRELKASGNPNAGLVFVLWGGHAVKLKKMVEALNKASGAPIDLIFVEAAHPAANGNAFHTIKTFEAVDAALAKLGLPPVDWLPKAASGSIVTVEASKPAKKVTAAKKATTKKVAVVAVVLPENDEDAPAATSTRPKRSVAKRSVAKMDLSDDDSFGDDDSEEEKPKKRKTATKKASAKKAAAADSDDSFEEEAPKPKRAKRS